MNRQADQSRPPRAAGENAASAPSSEPTLELETAVGPLLVPRDDEVITKVLAESGVWEADVGTWLTSNLRPGQTFVDVGAHVGYFTVLASQLVGPYGTVIALEPETRNLDLLHRNLARNHCTNVQVMPVAAYSSSGQMSLELNETNRGAHRLVALGEAGPTVRCVRLDDVLPAKIDVVKTDAQGYDHDIVAGLQRTIASNPQLLLITEVSPEELGLRGQTPDEAMAQYEALGLELYLLGAGMRADRATRAQAVAASLARSPATMPLILARAQAMSMGAPALKAFPRQAAGLTVRNTPDGVSVYDPERNREHRLNHSASSVFELCTGENSVMRIAEQVQRTYGLPEPPIAEVGDALAILRRDELLL